MVGEKNAGLRMDGALSLERCRRRLES